MAGSAMFAIAVSSEAIASAVKIAATAQRRSSGGKPSIGVDAGGFAVASDDIQSGSPRQGAVAPSAACTTATARATGTMLHNAYAKRRPVDRIGLSAPHVERLSRFFQSFAQHPDDPASGCEFFAVEALCQGVHPRRLQPACRRISAFAVLC